MQVFLGRVALKLVATKLVCIRLAIHLWRPAPLEKTIARSDRYTPWAGIPGR